MYRFLGVKLQCVHYARFSDDDESSIVLIVVAGLCHNAVDLLSGVDDVVTC